MLITQQKFSPESILKHVALKSIRWKIYFVLLKYLEISKHGFNVS